MRIYAQGDVFVADASFDEKDTVKGAGFWWHGGGCKDTCLACKAGVKLKVWWTAKNACAARLIDACDDSAKAALNAHVETVAASKANDSDMEIPSPDGYDYLPYQRGGIAYAMGRPNTLIGDEMGLGKTIQALGVVNATPEAKSVLCVVPASLRLNWRKEIERWIVRSDEFSIYVVEKGTKRVKTGRRVEKTTKHKDGTTSTKTVDETVSEPIGIPEYSNFVVVNYDLLSGRMVVNPDHNPKDKESPEKIWKPSHILGQLMARNWDILIVDEAHYLKNPKASRTKAVLGSEANKKQKVIAQDGLKDRSSRTLFLTGTPILNRPIEIQPLLAALAPDEFGNFFMFAKRYCNAKKGRFGWDFSGSSNLEELQERLRATVLVRRLKRDVLKELPPKRRQVIILPTNGAAKVVKAEQDAYASYDENIAQFQAEIETYIDSGDKESYEKAVSALKQAQAVAFAEMSLVRKAVAIAKIPKVLEHLDNVLESTDKIIVFGHHHVVCNAIKDHFGDAAVRLTGEDHGTEKRQAAVDRFQTDPTCKVFVGSIKAAGVGHTLTAATTVIFAELDWTPANVTQAEDRAHRIGQRGSVNIQHLVLDGSLDARMAQMCVDKQDVADRALDGDTVIPATFTRKEVATAKAGGKAAARNSKYPPISDAKKAAAHTALKILAGRCDGAIAEDGAGFNRLDTRIGHVLAGLDSLSDGQAWLAVKMATKYQRQLPDGVKDILDIGAKGI